MLHKSKLFLKSISAVVNLDVDDLTKRIKNLSIRDEETSSSMRRNNIPIISSSSKNDVLTNMPMMSTTSTILDRFKKKSIYADITRSVLEKTKSPFLDIPKVVKNLRSNYSYSLLSLIPCSSKSKLSLGFRFLPGIEDFQFKTLELPETFEGLSRLREKLGLTFSRESLYSRGILNFLQKGPFIADKKNLALKSSILLGRVLIEAITYHNGFYARFIILVQIGVGCTVWYGFHPGDVLNLPMGGISCLFSPIENYEQFFYNPSSYVYPGLEKVTLIENNNTLSTLANAFSEEKPFTEIQIPSCNNTPPHIIAGGVTLGLVVVVLLSVGLSPTSVSL